MLAADERAAVEESRRGSEQELMAVRTRLRDLGREHDELVSSVHRDEMARTQQKMRIEQLEERALEELGLDPDGLVDDYGPTTLIPFTGEVPEGEEPPEPTPFVREEQVKRLRAAERALSMLGRVNPLALEEFSAMEERHKFLTEQLEDLKRTRKDLLDIVREVDARVEQVFTEAYADVEKAFDSDLRPALPRRRGAAGAHRPRRHAQHRHRGRGAARRARRSSGSRCSPAASGRWSRSRSWSRSSRPGPRRSTSSTRSRRRSTTPTSAACWRSTRSCARTPSCS